MPVFQAYSEASRDENNRSARIAFDPGFDTWHTYRLEAAGTSLRLVIDGCVMAEAEEDYPRESDGVGVWSSGLEVEVRRFAVLALPEGSSPSSVAHCPA